MLSLSLSVTHFVCLADQSNKILFGFGFHVFGVFAIDCYPRYILMGRLKVLGLDSVHVLQLIARSAFYARTDLRVVEFRLVCTLHGHSFDFTVRGFCAIDEWLEQKIELIFVIKNPIVDMVFYQMLTRVWIEIQGARLTTQTRMN